MVVHEIGPDRLKGGQADIESDAPKVDALGLQRAEHSFGEMKARGRRGDGSFFSGEYRLVPVDILGSCGFVLSGPLDIGRKGCVADVMKESADIGLAEIEDAPAFTRDLDHFGLYPVGKPGGISLPDPFSRPAQDFPGTGHDLADEQEFDLRLAARAPEPGGQDARVVEDKDIARVHIPSEFTELVVPDRAGLPVDDHHPRVVAMGEGMLGDELRRQLVVEIRDAKGFAGGHGLSKASSVLKKLLLPGCLGLAALTGLAILVPQVGVSSRRDDPAPGRPVEEADAHEEGLVDALDRVLFLVDGRGDRADADRAAAEVLDDGREDLAVDVVEAEGVDLHHVQGPLGFFGGDDAVALDVDIVADAAQQAVGDARRAAGPQGDLAGPGVIDLDLEDPGRPLDDLLQVLVLVVVEAVDDAETFPQGRR